MSQEMPPIGCAASAVTDSPAEALEQRRRVGGSAIPDHGGVRQATFSIARAERSSPHGRAIEATISARVNLEVQITTSRRRPPHVATRVLQPRKDARQTSQRVTAARPTR
jgi:hypothetical protein